MPRVAYDDMVKFIDEVIKKPGLLDHLDLEPMDSYLGRDARPYLDFKKPMSLGTYQGYRVKGSDKIEKIAYGELHYMKRAKYCSFNMTAGDDYDLPIFTCEFDETPKRVSITIDFIPVVDIGVHPEYRNKYFAPLDSLWRKYRKLDGLTEDGRCLVQRRYAAWPWARASMSHYPIDGRVYEVEDRQQIVEAVIAYAKVWLSLLDNAEPVQDLEYKKEMTNRRKAVQKYFRELDPGGEVLKKIFGDEGEKLIVSLIF
jgi:hypothetical protein